MLTRVRHWILQNKGKITVAWNVIPKLVINYSTIDILASDTGSLLSLIIHEHKL